MGRWFYIRPQGWKNLQMQDDSGNTRSLKSQGIHRHFLDRKDQRLDSGEVIPLLEKEASPQRTREITPERPLLLPGRVIQLPLHISEKNEK